MSEILPRGPMCAYYTHAGLSFTLNLLTPKSDQDKISPYYIDTISCRQVMRIKEISIMELLIDPISNSPNEHNENHLVDSWGNYPSPYPRHFFFIFPQQFSDNDSHSGKGRGVVREKILSRNATHYFYWGHIQDLYQFGINFTNQ